MSNESEVPGTSPKQKKKRNPQFRDFMNELLKEQGLSLGSGRSNERARHVIHKADELKAKGYEKEARLLIDALDVSIRGAYELTRIPEEHLLAYCKVVFAGEARNLPEARRQVEDIIRDKRGDDPVELLREKNDMYRITSDRNKSSVLVTAQDLIKLHGLLEYIMPELREKAGSEQDDENDV